MDVWFPLAAGVGIHTASASEDDRDRRLLFSIQIFRERLQQEWPEVRATPALRLPGARLKRRNLYGTFF